MLATKVPCLNRRRRDFTVARLPRRSLTPSIAPSPQPAGVCYTYDDVIFHPGHIDFGAPEVSARTSRPTSPAAHASPPHFFKLLAPNVPFVRPVPG